MQKEFTHYNRSESSQSKSKQFNDWYDEVPFFCIKNGVVFTFFMRWYYRESVTAMLEIPNNSWKEALCIQEVLGKLLDVKEDISPLEFCEMLEDLGFTDKTYELNVSR